MSKNKETTVEPITLTREPAYCPPVVLLPVPPAKVEIGTCLGKMISCPVCHKPTHVTDARGARTLTQVVSSKFWVLSKCQGYCGNVLRRTTELVTVLELPQPEPVVKSLGQAVGHFVLCPREIPLPDESTRICGAKATAAWNMDDGHTIACPTCGCRPYPSETRVEMVG